MYLSLYCKDSKRLFKVCVWEGAGDRTETAIFWPQTYRRQSCVFLVLLMVNRKPWVPLCWVLTFFTASYQQPLWSPNSIGVPGGPVGRVWLSLPLLIYLRLQIYCNWPWDSNSTANQLLSWLRYIIVQRPLDRPLDLWNRMFNRHQVEITVMKFTGHSLPVHQSLSVPWEFFSSSYFISQFLPTRFPLITAIRMCHLLLVHHLGMAFLAGSIQQSQEKEKLFFLFFFFLYFTQVGPHSFKPGHKQTHTHTPSSISYLTWYKKLLTWW